MNMFNKSNGGHKNHPPAKPDVPRPGTPQPGDIPGMPRPGDPPPTKPITAPPGPIQPKV
ncbi:MAG: hypothetical protein WAO83_23485 [Fuerstiella sp.]